MGRTCTSLRAALLGTAAVTLAPVPGVHAQDFFDGEIIMISRDLTDGNVYHVQRVDPVTMEVTTLQSLSYPTTAAFPDETITYCAHRDRIIVPINNWPRRIVEIDSAGNTTTIELANPLFYNVIGTGTQAARGDGKVYFNQGSDRLWYYDENYVIHELTDTNGTQIDLNYGTFASPTGLYYHEPSNSLYVDRGGAGGGGTDEVFIYKLELNQDGTQVISDSRVRVDLAPFNADRVHKIGPGRTDGEIAFTMTTNDVNVGDIADMLNVNSFARDRFLTAEFAASVPGCSGVSYSSNSLTVGVFSALAGGDGFGRMVYPVEFFCSGTTQTTVELWSYEYGDIDTSGLTATRAAAGNNFDVENLLVIDLATCGPSDLNGDNALDIDDLLAFLDAFAVGDSSADLAPPTGTFDIDDLLAFLDFFALGCP